VLLSISSGGSSLFSAMASGIASLQGLATRGDEKSTPVWLQPALVALTSALVLIIVVVGFGAAQGIDSDAGWQFRAAQQYFDGSSSTINTLVSPDQKDLTTMTRQWISWWAPGNGLIISALLKLHLTLGQAARLMGILCLISGTLGWSLWIGLFQLPRWLQAALASLLPWTLYAHNALFFYGAESLLFGTVPWVLLLAYKAFTGSPTAIREFGIASLSGVSLGLLYVLKYSGVFVAVGVLGCLGIQALVSFWSERGARRFQRLVAVAICAVCCGVLVLAVNSINTKYSNTANLLTASWSVGLSFKPPLVVLGNVALAPFSADAPGRHVLSIGAIKSVFGYSEFLLAMTGIPGGLLLLFALWGKPNHPAAHLAYWVLLASALCLTGILLVSPVSYEARHIESGSLAILPCAFERGLNLWAKSRKLRLALALCIGFYVLAPFLFGMAAVAAKTSRHARHRPGPSGLYNPLLSPDDVGASRSILLDGFNAESDIWYVMHPLPALDLPGNVLIKRADDLSVIQLRSDRFYTSRPMRVRVVLPMEFEENDKAAAIREGFNQAVEWKRCPSAPTTSCWAARLEPVAVKPNE
jgi:hypothetical protein